MNVAAGEMLVLILFLLSSFPFPPPSGFESRLVGKCSDHTQSTPTNTKHNSKTPHSVWVSIFLP